VCIPIWLSNRRPDFFIGNGDNVLDAAIKRLRKPK